MSYIKFKVNSRVSDDKGHTKRVSFGRIQSDIANAKLYDLPTILHYLAKQGAVMVDFNRDFNSDFSIRTESIADFNRDFNYDYA
jgi:hypothetical protein